MDKPKTLLGCMHQAIKQAEAMEAENLVQAAATAAQIVAKSVTAETSAETTATLQDTFVTTYHNKYKNGNKLYPADVAPEGTGEEWIIDDATLYMDIATDQPDTITEVTIGEHTYKATDENNWKDPDSRYKNISIGMNAFIYLNVWKIVDGTLKVAIPYLYTGTDFTTGKCKVVAGGLTYEVNMIEPVTSTIALKSAVMSEKEGFTNDCVVTGDTIECTFGHAAQSLLMIFTANDTELTTDDVVFYRFDDNNHTVAIVKPVNISGTKYSYYKYLIAYANAPVTVSQKVDTTIHIVSPTAGEIVLRVIGHAIVEA